MKTNSYRTYFGKRCLLFAVLATGWLTACSSDNDTPAQATPGHIEIKGYDAAAGYTVAATGTEITGEKLDIDAKGAWQFVAEDDAAKEWLRIFPDKGSDGGVIRVIARESKIFTPKIARFRILLDGEEQPTVFTVHQQASVPYLTVTNNEGVKLQPDARTLSFTIRSSVDYAVNETYEGSAADWLADRTISEDGVITYQVPANETTEERTAKLVITVPDFEELSTEVTVTQLRTRQVSGFPVRWLFSAADSPKYKDNFLNNNSVTPESGVGSIGYMRHPDNTGKFTPSVGSTGHPTIKGTLAGDYWLFSAPVAEAVPANSVAHIQFITRSSATGARYWMLEYLDGSEWKPFGKEKRTVDIDGVAVEYTLDLVDDLFSANGGEIKVGTNNAMVDSDLPLANPVAAGGSVQIRYRCVSNLGCNGNTMASEHGGTSRIAGAAAGAWDTPSPSIDVRRPAEEGTLPLPE
jgi:hypothetical protein